MRKTIIVSLVLVVLVLTSTFVSLQAEPGFRISPLPTPPKVWLPSPPNIEWKVTGGYKFHQDFVPPSDKNYRYNRFAIDLQALPPCDDVNNKTNNCLAKRTVYAPVTGRVAQTDGKCYVIIQAKPYDRGWYVFLTHLDSVAVKYNQAVTQGITKIGMMGNRTGASWCGTSTGGSGVVLHMALLHQDKDGWRSYAFGDMCGYPEDKYFAPKYPNEQVRRPTKDCDYAPKISGLPDLQWDQRNPELEAIPPWFIDLWDYASDKETKDSNLKFNFKSTCPDGEVLMFYGHEIMISGFQSYDCDVTVTVKDPQGKTGQDTFHVNVWLYAG